MNSSRCQRRHTAAVWTHEKEEKRKRDKDDKEKSKLKELPLRTTFSILLKKEKKRNWDTVVFWAGNVTFFNSVKAIQRQQAGKPTPLPSNFPTFLLSAWLKKCLTFDHPTHIRHSWVAEFHTTPGPLQFSKFFLDQILLSLLWLDHTQVVWTNRCTAMVSTMRYSIWTHFSLLRTKVVHTKMNFLYLD